MSVSILTSADMRSSAYQRDPFPVWRRLRDEHPLFYDEPDDRWVLSRYADVVTVLRDPATYSTRTYQERFRPVFGRTLAELDGPRHIRERTIVAPAFVGRNLDDYRPFVDRAIDGLAAPLLAARGGDLVTSMTRRLPLTVIGSLLGFPESDMDMLFDIGNALLAGLEDAEPQRSEGAAAHHRLAAHLGPFIEVRRLSPSDDLISRIVHAEAEGGRLTHAEICSFVSFLLVAGGPTTNMALANFWWALLSEPDELERCRREAGRVDRAFSESLRRDGPIVYEDRRTNVEVEWYGRVLPVDSNVLVCLGAANTDDSVFADPETFDPDRSDLLMGVERKGGYRNDGVSGHLAFGLGSHFCMGYQLARAEAVAATEQFLLRLTDVRLESCDGPRVTWYERCVHALPVMLG